MSLVHRPSYPLAVVGLILIVVGVIFLLAANGIFLPPLSSVETEVGGVKIKIVDIPVETATALWTGAFLVLVGAILLISAFRR